jgi:hypothetical protein
MTGRGLGFCAGYDVPGYMQGGAGRRMGGGFGWGRGSGRGRGWRHGYFATGQPGWMRFGAPYGVPQAPYAQPAPDAEKAFLEQQAAALQSELDSVKKRLSTLEKDAEQKK